MLATGCASAPARVAPRAATLEDGRQVARALGPLLVVAGLWRGPADGCGASIAVLPVATINLGVAPHRTCKVGLLVTEGALATLPHAELQAALAHEIGHVQLGHFAARAERRTAERDAQRKIEERGTTAGAVVTAIPLIGPLLALVVIGTQTAAETATESTYRSYDQAEERAADRFAADLLSRLPDGSGCRPLAALLERLDRGRRASVWASWLSTHPSPAERLEAIKGVCP